MSQSTQTPEWGQPPTPPQLPKPKRQFTVTKIAIGVAAGIALFLVGSMVLLGMLLASGSSSDKQAASSPAASSFTPPDSAPDTPVTTQPAPAVDLAVGDSGSFTSEEGEGEIIVTKVEATKAQPEIIDGERFGLLVPKHGWYVVFHVKISVSSGSYDINPLDFYAKSSNGFHTEDAEYLEEWGPPLDSGTLHGGEHISGTIVYDTPTKHGKFVYAPNLDGDPLATWSY